MLAETAAYARLGMHHLTPQQLAERLGVETSELLERAARLGVPVVHGRIDRTLYEKAVRAEAKRKQARRS